VRTGDWPKTSTGEIPECPGETWRRVDNALRYGLRGLGPLGGLSLARLLAEERGYRNVQALPRLSEKKIAEWATAYRQRASKWPSWKSGPVFEADGEDWRNIDKALRDGTRGLPGGDSLAKLLARRLRARNKVSTPLLVKLVLTLADMHRERTGEWPRLNSGPIMDQRGDTWFAIDKALRNGCRGLRGGSSLARLLHKHRGQERATSADHRQDPAVGCAPP
jgi:hypothetical protein